MAQSVEGMTRQTGVHAAGVVIADRPLVEHAPLYRDGPAGRPVVQYEMKAAEGVGLIKFDFLGLKTLDQIRDAANDDRAEHRRATRTSTPPWMMKPPSRCCSAVMGWACSRSSPRDARAADPTATLEYR